MLLAMNSAALNASEQGDHETARAQFRVIRERAQEIGERMMVAFATINLGGTAWRAGDFREGLEESQRAVELFREGGDDSGVANALENCGWTSLGLSDPAGAKAFFHEALKISGHLGWLRGIAVNGPVIPSNGRALPLGLSSAALDQECGDRCLAARDVNTASGNSALTTYCPASTTSEIRRSTQRLDRT
jgi:Tetratricopeptide repeat